VAKPGVQVGLILSGASGLLAAGYYWLLRRPQARANGKSTLVGLRAPVEVIRDRWGIPHIYAENDHDLMYAQGFVHAQERLWQMDYNRRLASGRLAEIIGPQALPLDRWIRILGLRRAAERDRLILEPHVSQLLEAYVMGVNARIAQGRLPVEFSLLRYRPESWTITDTLVWAKMMAWTLSGNWESELLRAHLVAKLGPELAAELEPDMSSHWPSILHPGVDYTTTGMAALERAKSAKPYVGPGPYDGLGSNSWVLGGNRTASGRPLLANDMHLFLSIPAIWFENHLVGGDLDVTGVSFPGVPGVIVGHNPYVAWGFTNGFADVQDLYMEHLRRDDRGDVQYEFKGEWHDATVIQEHIKVRGEDTAVEEVIQTPHGPIVNSLAGDFAGEQPLALRWTTLESERMFLALYKMNRARNCREFREALRYWSSPAQNTVYSDTEGNIGYTFAGRVPIRAKGEGLVPVPGWIGEYEWTGYIPFEELPHLYNPPQGYILTANNRVVDQDYPYFISREFVVGERAERIAELIESQARIDLDYIQGMQFDQVSLFARNVAKHIREIQAEDPELAAVVGVLQDWNGEISSSSPAVAIYEVFNLRLMDLILKDKLGDLAIRYTGKGPTPVLAEMSIFSQRAREWLQTILEQPESHWFALGHGETRDEVLRIALQETVEYLKGELGPQARDWTWGKLHRLVFAHPLGQGTMMDRVFNRGPYPVGGDNSTIWLTSFSKLDLRTENLVGPPFRFIADLGDWRNSLGLLAPGQSGHPGSQHYADQVDAWFTKGYHPMLFNREDIEGNVSAVLHLLPSEG
jgi:penicillin amidase